MEHTVSIFKALGQHCQKKLNNGGHGSNTGTLIRTLIFKVVADVGMNWKYQFFLKQYLDACMAVVYQTKCSFYHHHCVQLCHSGLLLSFCVTFSNMTQATTGTYPGQVPFK